MKRKELFEQLLQNIDEDKRDEAYDQLAAVDTRAEKIAILESHGVSVPTVDEVFGKDWEDKAIELSDDELQEVIGGDGITWKRDCNCEP